MALDVLRGGQCAFFGPALPEPFVRLELERQLQKHNLLPDARQDAFETGYELIRTKLRGMSPNAGPLAIRNRLIEPMVERLGYQSLEPAPAVVTREGEEDGGILLRGPDSVNLRCWSTGFDADLDAPTKRGRAYRYSPVRVAQRVLLASGERVGLVTNGTQLRMLLCDPARPDSEIVFNLDYWRSERRLPDSFLLLLALASPKGVTALPEIIEQARLQQSRVTKELRTQARQAVEAFIQYVLDNPANAEALASHTDRAALAKELWREGLILVYRLLFVLKCEATHDPSRVFKFAGTSIWRNTYSPTTALARIVRKLLDESAQTGRFLEDGLRVLFRIFAEGMDLPGVSVRPLGGALFGTQSTPLLSGMQWGEHAVAHLLDKLLWTTPRRGAGRERVHYGPLDVEDLGRVYEALLELEPGIAGEPMCRLRRAKLEVVVPAAQGERYREVTAAPGDDDAEEGDEAPETEEAEEEAPARGRGKGTKVLWIEEIPANRFYLRVGLGRKASGSFYTPHSFVRFLVQETLGPQCDERSPRDNPQPLAILKLKVLDPACGSGHFLVEACRYLAGRLYEAVRLCDELAAEAESASETEADENKKRALLEQAKDYRDRIIALPDERDELLQYLPSRSQGAEDGSLSSYANARAEAICRRLVAVHCIYGVDINPLAVELAKLSLWIESHAEGYPLTFLDHRIVLGNSLTGPFAKDLIKSPGSQHPVQNLFSQNLYPSMQRHLGHALNLVRHLEASVGTDAADIARKLELKRELDERLLPFRVLAAAWAGGVMLGTDQPDGKARCDDEGYAELLRHVGQQGGLPARIENANLRAMIAKGLGVGEIPIETAPLAMAMAGCADDPSVPAALRVIAPALPYDLAFAEVFHPTGIPHGLHGFDTVIGNPPWDKVRPKAKEFFATYDFSVLEAPTKRERTAIQERLEAEPGVKSALADYTESIEEQHRAFAAYYSSQVVEVGGDHTGGDPDLFRVFMERNAQLLSLGAFSGVVVPSAFHANEGATGVRRLYLEKMALRCCYSFENKRKLFEIHRSFKFALVVVQKFEGTVEFPCAFYLHDDEWLFSSRNDRPLLMYSLDFVKRTGGEYLSLLELRSQADAEVAKVCFARGEPFGRVCERLGIELGRELHMTDDAWRFTPTTDVIPDGAQDPRDPEIAVSLIAAGYLLLHEGKTFWHYNDQWGRRPRYLIALASLIDKPDWVGSARFYRLAYRAIARSSDERTIGFCVLPPGCILSNSASCSRGQHSIAQSKELTLCGFSNTFTFDWTARIRASANVNQFILFSCPTPSLTPFVALLRSSALRLTCNHAGYEPLWREQLGDNWREPGRAPFTWPVLEDDDARWLVRAAIDAVVADAYGLSREQYAHVLSTFSHSSYPRAPELCLAAFDDLKQVGLEEFCRRHDPYWDIPLNESLPQPVIDLPIPEAPNTQDDGGPLFRDAAGAPTAAGNRRAAPAQPRTRRPRQPRSTTPAAPEPGRVASIRTLLELRRDLTTTQAGQELNMTTTEARKLLEHLVAQNQATKQGTGRGTTYHWRAR